MPNTKSGFSSRKNKSPGILKKSPLGLLVLGLFFAPLFWSCTGNILPGNLTQGAARSAVPNQYPVYTSYKEIPGISREEIDAIEALRRADRTFIYGMINSTECFNGRNGLAGYAVLFCRLLSDLFGISFTAQIRKWDQLVTDLDSGKIDFTGELSVTPERLKQYAMTGPIAERMVAVITLKDAPGPGFMTAGHGPRFGFLTGTTTEELVSPNLGYKFDSVHFPTVDDAYIMLRHGTVDAFFWDLREARPDIYEDLKVETFIPFVYNAVSMATANPELEPIISVVQKYLDRGLFYRLIELYNRGHRDFLSYRFFSSLTEAERSYVDAHSEKEPVPLLMEADNYPIAFYNPTEQKWQGIAWDILEQISAISGLQFRVINSTEFAWAEAMRSLEQGKGAMTTELIWTRGRDGRFLWGEGYVDDNYALISRVEQQDIEINDVPSFRVGFARNTAYMETFKKLFPRQPSSMEYPSTKLALAALERGDIDFLMGTKNMVLSFTNYLEKPGFKANLIFDIKLTSSFGFNRTEKILWSVIGKAQGLVNTASIVHRWQSKVFDYRDAVIRFRQPYLILLSVLFGIVIVLLTALLRKFNESRQKLEVMVRERTRELEIQKNAAQTAYRVKNHFLANMSHELRTPLNAIIGLSQAELERGHEQSPPQKPALPERPADEVWTIRSESQDNLKAINHSGVILLNIVNDLLDISSLESGEITLTFADYSLPALAAAASDAARLFIGKKRIEFCLEADENLPLKLRGDKQRVAQIVHNLLSNAAKFSAQGCMVLRVGCEKPDQATDRLLLVFEVRDTGIGLEAGQVEKLFTDYGQADTSAGRRTGGIGMGLLIVKKLVDMMDGNLTVTSEFGRGSVFTVKIPQGIADPAPWGRDVVEQLRAAAWTGALKEKPCLSYARVLVVDDVPINHAVVRGIMQPYRMTIDAVSSGQEAVDRIAREEVSYDAVFMDHMMPGMNGLEAAIRIRGLGTEYAKNIPIIALTANALPENEELFLKNGFNAFMTKPINADTLNKVLLDWVWDKEKEKLLRANPPEKTPDPESGKEKEPMYLKKYRIMGVDIAAGVAQFGSEKTYLEIIKVFVRDTPQLLENIQNCLEGFRIMSAVTALEAIKNYTILVHGIKGSCYGICATPVGDMAKELETVAKARNFSRVLELNAAFVGTVKNLVEELKGILPQKKPEIEKSAPDPQLLQKTLDAAKSYNIDEVLKAIDELEQYRYKERGDLVQKLRFAAEEYEYAEIVLLLDPDGGSSTGH
ncbi:MAG: transporter substrate-binding domain-containing protein [Spirochaetaceae bacterium]|jgi:signal transduction histidine kinase/ABC-type amino acid transport substrate-binding protein/DNA-binding LytR/AlgR family response regulator|nr:transporter substrate-binding domain-containing protein [Spirochaetaceae bacterium]